ncbi:tRNA-uridine aminocarboxypropyltransferase [Shewanella intestini]|uniref:tRNA-uridine aminocarboxypropyltransferase n=1 Tax=Shewanella intestini TaxID=2017544 RepID=A0ABS5I3X0_9GAMM|nr:MULTISPECIES: tRNA-uridine aminocarboxypropyltransferase [Shewanella]MBR9728730.1 DTW domain-containing protein [Shewanella intestini]MRG36806.1 DTW domain-containing protein [Shewanella sp. XMDDZSB0408]
MARVMCQQCRYPQNACVCHAITPLTVNTEVVVLQHPSEVNHAKNSVKLMGLVLANLRVDVGESAADFAPLQAYLASVNKPVYLVYPNESSQTVAQAGAAQDCVILLIDGTWKKAYRILQLNPWLLTFPALHLDVSDASQYIIRKAKRADSLSTLEATAYVLNALAPQLDPQPLFAALDAMVQHRLNAMPYAVRKRYGTTTKDES